MARMLLDSIRRYLHVYGFCFFFWSRQRARVLDWPWSSCFNFDDSLWSFGQSRSADPFYYLSSRLSRALILIYFPNETSSIVTRSVASHFIKSVASQRSTRHTLKGSHKSDNNNSYTFVAPCTSHLLPVTAPSSRRVCKGCARLSKRPTARKHTLVIAHHVLKTENAIILLAFESAIVPWY